ncbi:Galactose oxidase [Ananas comosus]|uniref:Galactose oxidase n=1 Tax=Ananas comosus TaxID=4615 RepID=A0A199V9X8_ANACO|nr:Galactose oxidase [Ananas comosus]
MDLLSSAHGRVLLFVFHLIFNAAAAAAAAGRWDLLQGSIGVSAMHMQLLHNDRVIIFDRTDVGPSNLTLAGGACRHDPNELSMKVDCTAHSAEYDVAANAFRPLTVLTDTWCSSGTVAPDGTLVQTGGYNDGDRNARTFSPCANAAACDWTEHQNVLAVRRWYATNQILPDGRAIIIGGTGQFNYEFYPKTNAADAAEIPLPFLSQTHDPEENNLYPFVHLNIDGNLFIFANNRAILFDYVRNAVASQHGNFLPALATCGRIKINDAAPEWRWRRADARVMGDMVLLPSGEVLIINGAGTGAAGWEIGHNPALAPVLYHPDAAPGTRFAVQAQGTVPRMYHSTAALLRDGRVLVGGSNPHERYVFADVEYPTDLSLEPSRRSTSTPPLQPCGEIISPLLLINHGTPFPLRFHVGQLSANGVSVTMASPAFATHSFSMNQRLLILETMNPRAVGDAVYEVIATAPAKAALAPPGYYMVFVVNNGIPSEGVWAQIQ